MQTATSFEGEVAEGVSQEERILRRWADHHPKARGFLKGGTYDDFDFVVFDTTGVVYCYLEVKFRRVRLDQYGDAMFPTRKHTFARRVELERKTPTYAVTEYADGALVEVDLRDDPADQRDITRRDRPGMKPVPHVFYDKTQFWVLELPRG